jgi:hypothetical protein
VIQVLPNAASERLPDVCANGTLILIRTIALAAALLATASLPKLATVQNSAVVQNCGPIWGSVPNSPMAKVFVGMLFT